MRRFIAKRSRGYSRTIGFNCILQAGGFSLWKRSPSLGKPSLKWIENSIQLRIHVTGNWKLSLAFHTKGWPISVTEHKQSCLWKGICWSRCFFPARISQTSLRTGNKNLSLLTVLRGSIFPCLLPGASCISHPACCTKTPGAYIGFHWAAIPKEIILKGNLVSKKFNVPAW